MNESLPRQFFPYGDLSYLLGYPESAGIIRKKVEDFCVDEELSFEPSGSGEHLFLKLIKRQLNTDDMVKKLSKEFNVPRVAIGYAGKKDKYAVTSQWFSVHLPKKDDQLQSHFDALSDQFVQIEQQTEHLKKLKKGCIKRNHFKIIVREISHQTSVEDRLQQIKLTGVPNYFGQQRFGNHNNNLLNADRLFGQKKSKFKRTQKSMILSAVRSYLFNLILSQRIEDGSWNKAVIGDVMQHASSHSIFQYQQFEQDVELRTNQLDMHPTGGLYGAGNSLTRGGIHQLEESLYNAHADWCQGLEKNKLKHHRRSLRLRVENLSWEWLDEEVLQLNFSLVSGSYATAFLRELVVL